MPSIYTPSLNRVNRNRESQMIKLNVGGGSRWEKEGWKVLDYRAENSKKFINGYADQIKLKKNTCDIIFCSHVIEHIPHIRLEKVFLEFNRVLSKNGVLRILTPDLKKLAKAYINKDNSFFKNTKKELGKLRTDLGWGGKFMNFVVAPGQDTILMDNKLENFICGLSHQYLYDFEMLKIILSNCGFNNIKHMKFCQSTLTELKQPLCVKGLNKKWKNLNPNFYKKNNLKNYFDYKKNRYITNFKLTGFDRDPTYSLIVEARKYKDINRKKLSFTFSSKNNNLYGQTLAKDKKILRKLKLIKKIK